MVGVADCEVSADAAMTIATFALGSCIAVTLHDPHAGIGGLLHFALPDSLSAGGRGRPTPFAYADSGFAELLRRCLALGADKRRLVACAAGGASITGDKGVFDIGHKNFTSLCKQLAKGGVALQQQAIGGNITRSVRLDVGTGRLWLKSDSQRHWDLFRAEEATAGRFR